MTYQGGNEQLRFEIDGQSKAVSLRIAGFNKRLVSSLSPEALDMLEIAALVYGVDAAVSRGGPTDQGMGRSWHRGFKVEMPVRNAHLWNDPAAKAALEETLQFLSGDRFHFVFRPSDTAPNESKWFDFGSDSGWQADRVLMFSGGLDSFAGALEEIIEQRHRVALVSHYSSTKIQKVQSDLFREIVAKEGGDRLGHFPMRIQLKSRTNREGTHRTRSFLFAVLGLVTASVFGQKRVSFHENGVVSLNLPPVANVVGTRATRTTHPQTLHHFSRLFSQVFGRDWRIDNPFFWRTKTEVLQTIARLGMAATINVTSSCADTHNRTRQHPHCGRCSQCIDRRFAVLAAGIARSDSRDAYALDLLEGKRASVTDKELALSYVRNARVYEHIAPELLQGQFPAILASVEHLGLDTSVALDKLADLLRRHGSAVCGAMRSALGARAPDDYPPESLLRLFGDLQAHQALGAPAVPSVSITSETPDVVELLVDRDQNAVSIDNAITFGRASKTAELLIVLAELHLEGQGAGLLLFDHPTLSAAKLAQRVSLENEEALRRRMNRARIELRKKFASARRKAEDGEALIETILGQGYRLAPDRIAVKVHRKI